MRSQTFFPRGGLPGNSDIGIIMWNHYGSSVTSDTAGDAAAAANHLRRPVTAINRPGSGLTSPYQSRKLTRGYERVVQQDVLSVVERLSVLGLRRFVLAGRSAGGAAALIAANAPGLPVVAVHAQEPVGWDWQEPAAAEHDYNAYRSRQKELLAAPDNTLISPLPTEKTGWDKLHRMGQNIVHGLIDRSNNQDVFRQPLACMAAYNIARNLPGVQLDMHFAEYSLALGTEDPQELQMGLRVSRMQAARSGGHAVVAPINAVAVPNTVHSSFDLRTFSIGLLEQTVRAAETMPL
ncbi:MAG TPA: hypothetical protein VLI54_02845 [Bacillota bacterium]|nr:hypothetical protein [Bacillota bacterium]